MDEGRKERQKEGSKERRAVKQKEQKPVHFTSILFNSTLFSPKKSIQIYSNLTKQF